MFRWFKKTWKWRPGRGQFRQDDPLGDPVISILGSTSQPHSCIKKMAKMAKTVIMQMAFDTIYSRCCCIFTPHLVLFTLQPQAALICLQRRNHCVDRRAAGFEPGLATAAGPCWCIRLLHNVEGALLLGSQPMRSRGCMCEQTRGNRPRNYPLHGPDDCRQGLAAMDKGQQTSKRHSAGQLKAHVGPARRPNP